MITTSAPETEIASAVGPGEASAWAGGHRLLAVAVVIALSGTGFVLLYSRASSARVGETGAFELSSQDFLQPAAGSRDGQSRLNYLSADGPVALANGASIALAEDLQVAVTVTPFPPTTFDATVDLLLTTADGTPIVDAEVITVWDMAVMWHGPFETRFANLGDGHYLARFDFFMFGPWQLETQVRVPQHAPVDDISISIYTWPE